jgi:multidrug efflux system outer membrane protein
VTRSHPIILVCAILGALVCSTAHASAPGPSDVETIGWDELVEQVERTSPFMDAARSGLDAMEAQLRRAQWARFPSFRLEAGGTPTPEIQTNGFDIDVDWSRWGYFYRVGITMVQPVFTFGRIHALRTAARDGVDVGTARVDLARWELRVRMAQAYYGAQLAKELGEILRDGRAWLEKAESRMNRLRAADADGYDQMEHLRLKTRSAEFFQLEADQRQLEVASLTGLRLLMSRGPNRPLTPIAERLTPLELSEVTVETLVSAMVEHEPKFRMAQAAGRAKSALADAKGAELWPQVVFLADGSVNDSNVLSTEGTLMEGETLGYSIAVLLGMRWNLDVPQRLAVRDQARAEANAAVSSAYVARDMAELEVRRIHQALSDKRMLIDVYARSKKAAKGWLSAAWDTHDAGFGSFRNVMDALLQFYGKRLAHLKAVHEYNIMIHELSRAVGVDVTTLTVAKEQQPMNETLGTTSNRSVTP